MFCSAGAVYCGALFGFISLIYVTTADGTGWVLALLFGTFVGDTSAYAIGRLFGRRKLAPRLSPGKTWAGAVGGAIGSCLGLAVVKLFFLPELSWPEVPILAIPLSIACQLGDLAESFLKRCFGAKDSGKIIPGHGGLLDRADALIFGAPVVYLFTVLRSFL
jgi:phosphatidate cytidylyltransferase